MITNIFYIYGVVFWMVVLFFALPLYAALHKRSILAQDISILGMAWLCGSLIWPGLIIMGLMKLMMLIWERYLEGK